MALSVLGGRGARVVRKQYLLEGQGSWDSSAHLVFHLPPSVSLILDPSKNSYSPGAI